MMHRILVRLLSFVFFLAVPVNGNGSETVPSTQESFAGVSGTVFSGERVRTYSDSNSYDPTLSPVIVRKVKGCNIWGVVTTINAPTKSIYKVAKHAKLCLVIVADLKTPTEDYFKMEKERETVVFLSVEKQKAMQNLEFVNELPWNHFGRKNMGYIYAIMYGATVIFDFDDDNELISDIPTMEGKWLVANGSQVFNPYPTFVSLPDVAWPRGFPLTQIQNMKSWVLDGGNITKPNLGVVQSLANHDPDMDAIFRLTRKLPLNFDADKQVLVSPGTFSSYNAQATLHYALWGTLLPVSVHGRVSDIWRSYIMQRLMHDVGQVVGFVSPFVKQERNAHNYQGDFMAERPLYEKTEALIRVLSEWKGESSTFENRFVELFIELYERNFIELNDVILARKWILSLKQIGYIFPNLNGEIHKVETVDEPKKVNMNPWLPPKSYCYKKGNDWSDCAGDHLLYQSSSSKELLSRQFMCIHEPFCWMQLDWRHTDPPEWECPQKRKMRFYDLSYHDAVMASAATTLEKSPNKTVQHEVFLCNTKDSIQATNNYKYNFKNCPTNIGLEEDTLYIPGKTSEYKQTFGKDPHFKSVDALIFGFGSSAWQNWIGLDKTLILALWHVADQKRCTKDSSQSLFDDLRNLAFDTHLHHIIAGNTLYHTEYIRHYTGLNPIYLPATLISAVDVYLTKYAGVVVIPYSITNAKSVEQYAMNIPMFAPTVEFAKQLFNDRTATYKPYCPQMTSAMHPEKHQDSPYDFDPNVRIETNGNKCEADVKFWISFAEIYNWPCIQYFNSWEHLFQLLESTDLSEMSACMKQANKWRHFEELQNWCWVTTTGMEYSLNTNTSLIVDVDSSKRESTHHFSYFMIDILPYIIFMGIILIFIRYFSMKKIYRYVHIKKSEQYAV